MTNEVILAGVGMIPFVKPSKAEPSIVLWSASAGRWAPRICRM
jgi:hypothetical protein